MSLQATATIVTRTRTDVTVLADLSAPGRDEKRTKLSPEEMDRVRKRSNELVNIIKETPTKKHEVLAAAWSEWGLLARKKAKHTTAELDEKIKELEKKNVKIKELEGKLATLSDDLAYNEGTIIHQADELKGAREELKTLRERLTEHKDQKSTLEGRVDELTRSNKGSMRERDSLRDQLAKLRQEDRRERQLLLQRREEQSKCLEQAKKSHEEERDKRCLYAEELRLEIASREEFRADNLKLNERIGALEQEAAAKDRTCEEQEALWKRQLEDSRAAFEEQKQKHATLSTESAEKQARIDAQGVEITRLKGNLTALNQKIEEQKQAIDGQCLTIRNQTRDLATCITERDVLREKRDDRVKLQEKIDELQQELEVKSLSAQNNPNPKTKKPRRK